MLALSGLLPPELSIYVTAMGLLVLRLSLMVFLLPALGSGLMNARTRVVIVVALSAAAAPILLPDQLAAVASEDILKLAVFESVIGFALGFGFRVMIFVLMIAGTIIAQAISLSQLFGAGTASEPNPSVSMLLIMVGAVLFVTLEFHTKALGLFYDSYLVFPMGQVPALDGLAEWAMARTASAFALGISLSLPFVLINFVYNVILGLINQAMPQMMVTFIGVPANVLAGIFLLVIAVTSIMLAWLQDFDLAFAGFW